MAFRSSALAQGSGVTSLTATPAGVVAGDYLCGVFAQDGGASGPTVPTGWVERVNNDTVGPDGGRNRYGDKIAAGGDDFTWTVPSAAGMLVNVALSGRNTTTPRTAVAGEKNETSNASPISVSHTGVTAAAGDDVLVFMALDQTAAADQWNFSTITGYTEQHDDSTTDWLTSAFDYRENVSAGATGALNSTATQTSGTTGAGWSVIVAAIASDGGGGGGGGGSKSQLMLLGVGGMVRAVALARLTEPVGRRSLGKLIAALLSGGK